MIFLFFQVALFNLATLAGPVSGQRRLANKREPAFSVDEGYANVARLSQPEKVGETVFFFTASHFQVIVTTDQTQCLLSQVHLEGMPFSSPQHMMEKTFIFQLPLEEVENLLCGNGQEQNEIRGNITSVCVQEDNVEQVFHDFFIKGVTCSRNPPSLHPPDLPPIDASAYQINTFHMRIPKTGSTSIRSILITLLGELQGMRAKRTVCDLPGMYYADPSMGKEFFDDPTGTRWAIESGREGCIFVLGHRPLSEGPFRNYTVMRDPTELVLSEYFHCKESDVRRSREENEGIEPMTASLDEFLERWMMAMDDYSLAPLEFNCFGPINPQAGYLQVAKPEDLKHNLEFVGLTSRLITSACIEVIQVTGLVPQSCDCTSREESPLQSTQNAHNDLGVTHHGATFRATDEQLAMIDILTSQDRALYEEAKRLFDEEVVRIESEYSVRLC